MLAHDILKKDDRTFTSTSSAKAAEYFGVLIVGKVARCIGTFLVDTLAKQIHVIPLLWLFKLISAVVLLFAQKPFVSGRSIRRSLYVRVGQLAFYNCVVEALWFYGITFCGPLRSILVFEQNPSILLTAALVLCRVAGSPAKTRGVFALIIGFLILFVMDADSSVEMAHAEAHRHQSGLNHAFYHVMSWFGVSDHKGGILLLVLTIFLKMGYDSQFRHVAVEIGGPKRLYALVNIFSAALLFPFGFLTWILSQTFIYSYIDFLALLILGAIALMVVDFYVEQFCFQHVADPVTAIARWSPVTMFVCSLLMSWIWYGGSVVESGAHPASAGVTIAVALFCYVALTAVAVVTTVLRLEYSQKSALFSASISLTSAKTTALRGGVLIGMSELGIPMYTYGEAFLQKTSKSVISFCSDTLKDIMASSDSRRIFWFLCANLAFCGVEFLYGFLTNSLGLISDGIHMLFDCFGLVMGLVASVMSRWPANRHYSFGYGRVELLSGFCNSLFLLVIALFIFLEAVERLLDPPTVVTDKLLLVAVAGLLVNLFGLFALHGEHGHSHGGGGSHGHSHHGHSHGGANANMQGVFLHVLTDTLGSVFVIISTLMLQWFGWKWVDPLCSLILSVMIVGSVVPLVKSSGAVLLQSIPEELRESSEHILDEILNIEGVRSFSNFHLWQLKSDTNVASLCVQAAEEAHEQHIRRAVVEAFRRADVQQVVVQVEKAYFEARMLKASTSYRPSPRVDRATFVPRESTPHSHAHSHGGHGHSHDHASDHGHSHEHGANGHAHSSGDTRHGHSHGGGSPQPSATVTSHGGHGHSHGDSHGHSHSAEPAQRGHVAIGMNGTLPTGHHAH